MLRSRDTILTALDSAELGDLASELRANIKRESFLLYSSYWLNRG